MLWSTADGIRSKPSSTTASSLSILIVGRVFTACSSIRLIAFEMTKMYERVSEKVGTLTRTPGGSSYPSRQETHSVYASGNCELIFKCLSVCHASDENTHMHTRTHKPCHTKNKCASHESPTPHRLRKKSYCKDAFLHWSALFACIGRQRLPALVSSVCLHWSAIFACIGRHCLPASVGTVCLHWLAMFACIGRQRPFGSHPLFLACA